ncbi:MAG TPA: PAS-domain containing protein, partial [Xanthobacteraceae bacterium]|nr:PAS-domain containing protein [Xanthobacteraceae bacterium]
MSQVLAWLASEHDPRLMVLAGAVCVLLAILGASLARRIREKDLSLATALKNMPQGVVMFENERFVVCNDRYLEMYGLSSEVIKPGCSLKDVIRHRIAIGSLDRDFDDYYDELVEVIKRGKTTSFIVESKDGRAISVINRPFAGGFWVGTHEDITERRRAERELERTKSFLNAVIESVPATIVVKNAQDLRYVLVNRAGERYYGIDRQQMIGKTAHEVFPARTAAFIAERDRRLVEFGEEAYDQHAIETPGNGTRIVKSRRLGIRGDDGQVQYLVGVIEDVTERKQAEDRIAHLAHHDALTDLPNRAAFTEHLQARLRASPAGDESFAVLCLDLDRFKDINDVFGHSTGDAFL